MDYHHGVQGKQIDTALKNGTTSAAPPAIEPVEFDPICYPSEAHALETPAQAIISAQHAHNRADFLFILAKNIRSKSLLDDDKKVLRHMELAIMDGNLSAFENIVRELPNSRRADLLAEASSDLNHAGYEIFQMPAASTVNGDDVGNDYFVVCVRRGDTMVEVHTSDSQESTAEISNAESKREVDPKQAFERQANEAIRQCYQSEVMDFSP